MAEGSKSAGVTEEQALEIRRLTKRLDMLDQRLDNIDTQVSAVAERVLSRLITLNLTCPHCGKEIEISLVSNPKPKR